MSHNIDGTSYSFIMFGSDLASGIVEEEATVSQSDAFDGVSLSDLSLGMLSLYIWISSRETLPSGYATRIGLIIPTHQQRLARI